MRNLAAKNNYTLEEYAELEKATEERLEYFEGNVWSMAGASIAHETIVSNLDFSLRTALKGRSCRTFLSNTRVKVPVYSPYRYPDLTALCGEIQTEDFYGLEVLTNPSLIVEVLSPLTEAFDATHKFTYYKSIESFNEYLLISEDRPRIVLFTKRDENAWLHRDFNSFTDMIYLNSLDCEISVAEIYLEIEFPKVENPKHPFQIFDNQ